VAAAPGFRIGPHEVPGGLCLAPMAGNTNLAYRRLCRRFGAGLTTTEMVSARALLHGDRKSLDLLARGEDEHPVAAQIFGAEPEVLAAAARRIQDLGFPIVDLNMGCPVPKITGGGGGSNLLREPDLATRCVEAMVRAVDIPVTVKLRAGWDERTRNAPELARRLAGAGAAAITVHGRTREQKYSGRADLALIAEVAAAAPVPVVGNGDVDDPPSARRMLATGVAGIAIGRGALGRPWLFARIRADLEGRALPPEPDAGERAALLLELARGVVALHGEHRGMRIMRRLAADFLKGQPGAPRLRAACSGLATLADLEVLAARSVELAAGKLRAA